MVQIKLYSYLLVNLLYLSLIGASDSNDECLIPCPKIMAPVCAFDGESYRIFHNDCLLQKKICEDSDIEERKWIVSSMDQCYNGFTNNEESMDCFNICDEAIDPICAMNIHDYRIFPNNCEMKQENCNLNEAKWTEVNFLECFKNTHAKSQNYEIKNCQKPCFRLYNPICAYDGEELKVFGNICNFEVENCKFNNKWKLTELETCMQEGLLNFA